MSAGNQQQNQQELFAFLGWFVPSRIKLLNQLQSPYLNIDTTAEKVAWVTLGLSEESFPKTFEDLTNFDATVKKAFARASRDYHPDKNAKDDHSAFNPLPGAKDLLLNFEEKLRKESGFVELTKAIKDKSNEYIDPIRKEYKDIYNSKTRASNHGPIDPELKEIKSECLEIIKFRTGLNPEDAGFDMEAALDLYEQKIDERCERQAKSDGRAKAAVQKATAEVVATIKDPLQLRMLQQVSGLNQSNAVAHQALSSRLSSTIMKVKIQLVLAYVLVVSLFTRDVHNAEITVKTPAAVTSNPRLQITYPYAAPSPKPMAAEQSESNHNATAKKQPAKVGTPQYTPSPSDAKPFPPLNLFESFPIPIYGG